MDAPETAALLGARFQASLTREERHGRGVHYTREADIQRVVLPTIVRPFQERLARAETAEDLRAIHRDLISFQVLDPACGTGNFLQVAYHALKALEHELLRALRARSVETPARVSAQQLHGIDVDPEAVALARRALAADLRVGDALFDPWPRADAIIGNPPFQSKNKMTDELGAAYVRRLRAAYPGVPGRADYCVYWFRRAHDELAPGGRAGLVGTNTIRQNYSREGGLDHIVEHGGTITEAVSTQVWSGDATVHVSIVNWTKGSAPGPKKLFTQLGDQPGSPWKVEEVARISAALSSSTDVTAARSLPGVVAAGVCHQGQTHGHEGFLLSREEAGELRRDPRAHGVIHPYLTGDDLVGAAGGQPSRFVIDLNHCDDAGAARSHGAAFARVEARVRGDVEARARDERAALGKHTGPRQSHAERWWKHWRGRPELVARLATLPRYVACSRVTKRPIFEVVASAVRPNDALTVFLLADDYSFGILQSTAHWAWFKARCSTMKGDWRYTSSTVFDAFPWPQTPGLGEARAVAERAAALRGVRRALMAEGGMSLRQLYVSAEATGKHPLNDAQAALDEGVRAAYGMGVGEDVLGYLLGQNAALATREGIVGPGLPPCVGEPAVFVSEDCVRAAARLAR